MSNKGLKQLSLEECLDIFNKETLFNGMNKEELIREYHKKKSKGLKIT